jgi:UDP-N-acetylglucosamine 4,6-dehydratase
VSYGFGACKDDLRKDKKTMFKDKTLLITGGTGSFGNAVLNGFLNSELTEIRIFSRDEKKQDDMRKRYNSAKLKFYIGDVRDQRSVAAAMRGVDYLFHAAALKQVPSCEFHPMEAVRTNVLGTENVLTEAVAAGVKRVVCLSTDKAVYPINAMGISKAMMEKVMVAASRNLEGRATPFVARATATSWPAGARSFPCSLIKCVQASPSPSQTRS